MSGFRNGLQKVGETYHYCFRIHGKQYKGSTRAHDQATAKRVLEEVRQRVLLGKPLVPPSSITFRELVEKWMAIHRSTASPKHIQSVDVMSRVWLLGKLGNHPIDQITTGWVLEIRAEMLERGRALATVNHMLRVVKLLLNFAVQCGDLEALKVKLKPLRAQQKPRTTVPALRVQEFLQQVDCVARGTHSPVMIRVMLGLGLRESEVLGMRWEWFNAECRTYQVGISKGKEARVIPVPNWLWDAIHSMPCQILSPLVFPGDDGRPHHPHYCRKVLRTVAAKINLGKLTQHRLRATFATLHAEAGTPLTEIQGMLGHKNITTTMIYVEQSLDAKRRAQDNLSLKLGLA